MAEHTVSPSLVAIAKDIRVSLPAILADRINVFLIGKSATDVSSVRAQVLRNLSVWSKVRVFYPEDLFMELIYGGKLDLLELETLLAQSVHVIVLCVESWGSVAELGAFANHKKLSHRLVIVTDKNRIKDQSFINLGPIRHIKKSKISRVLSHDFTKPLGDFGKRVRSAIRQVAAKTRVVNRLSNLVVAETFVLAAVSIMSPISWVELLHIVMKLETTETEKATVVCRSALSSLFKQRAVLLQNGQYEITPKGRSMLYNVALAGSHFSDVLDNLRVEVLNLRLRKEYHFGERAMS